jgi:multidrug efflux system membrane fusion protein
MGNDSHLRQLFRTGAPVFIVLGAVLISVAMVAAAPELEKEDSVVLAPTVNVIVAEPRTIQLRVKTSGTIEAQTEAEIVPQVTGQVIWMSPAMVSGGFFYKDDVLVKVDRREYELKLQRAEANFHQYVNNFKYTKRDLERIRSLLTKGLASNAEVDKAENDYIAAEANWQSAKIDVTDAKRNLAFTEIRAPFSGRVREISIDIGSSVDFRGNSIATVYSTDYAEVRLPIADYEVEYLSLPLWGESSMQTGSGTGDIPTPVIIRARFAGKEHKWEGQVVRTEGEIDAETRMVHVVARIKDPYVRIENRPPLTVGLFVNAEIIGHTVDNAFVVPRASLRNKNQVLALDTHDRLRFADVDVLRIEGDRAILRGGLAVGDRVVVSRLKSEVVGMRLIGNDVPVDETGLPEEWRL